MCTWHDQAYWWVSTPIRSGLSDYDLTFNFELTTVKAGVVYL